jgi:rubrerythrin
MFGRRRPLLGTAVVVAASRSAARHEVASQNQAASMAEMQRRADQAEQDRRTQLAIDDALMAERKKNEEAARLSDQNQAQGHYQSQPPEYSIDRNKAAGSFFCSDCGTLSNRTEKFCSGCGRRHPVGDMAKVDM